jgi:hypothetical protein
MPMHAHSFVFFLLVAALPTAAYASWFELCDFDGNVQHAAPGEDGAFKLQVSVLAAKRASVDGQLSYTDCSEHIGEEMTVSLRIPKNAGTPGPGDLVSFSTSSMDAFRKDGSFAGNQVKTQFLRLQKSSGGEHGG